MVKKRRDKRVWFVALGVFVAVFLFSFLIQKFKNMSEDAEAANLANFDPGYIISDYQMGNYNSMNEAQIQAFLKSKNHCNDRDFSKAGRLVGYLSEGSPYTWHVVDGHFVCMADENFNGESAAHIIYRAAQDYRINPQVLLVLLQKEQGLVTDTYPNSIQYRSAMGYGCPDTAACSSEYYGFKNQVRKAASLFRTVLDGGWSNYPVGSNYIQYAPNAACGGSWVNIRNRATSALYRYTPYQPNAGALAAGYGTAHCGAYGNRNFYLYFEDWFGNIRWDGWPSLGTVLTNNRVASAGSDLGVTYQTHIEHYGWLDWVNGGEMSGTAGYGARVEALSLKLANREPGGIEYRAHIQSNGWEKAYKKDGEVSGTTGESLRIEAVQIRLTGDIARRYDVYYRAHVQGIGWMDWVKNDEISGTVGEYKRVEAIQVRLVLRDLGLGPNYSAHVQSIGWMDWVKNGKMAGTTGQSKQIEAIKIELPEEVVGDIKYRVHAQSIGWMDWVKNGELAGTTGQFKRIEAIEIELSDTLAKRYDIYYRTHVQGIGWMDWVKNGELAGTTGQFKRIEAIEIELVDK